MIRINLDNPVNTFDNIYNSTKKRVQDIVTNSYDDIDNVIPDDILDIEFSEDNNKETEKQNFFKENLEKFINIFYKKE